MAEGAKPSGFLQRDLSVHPKAYFPDYRSTRLRAPQRPLVALECGLEDTTGPAFGHDILGEHDADLLTNYAAPGETAIGPRILVTGRVLDEHARPVPNTLVEVWQANAGGRYRHVNEGYVAPLDPNFAGCGRTITDEDGVYTFWTVQPGPYPWPNGGNDWRPAHIHFSVFGTGFAQRLITQMYFEGDPLIPLCPIVNAVSDASAISRLTARFDMDATLPMDARAYRFDVVLRGEKSMVFENRLEGN